MDVLFIPFCAAVWEENPAGKPQGTVNPEENHRERSR